MIILKNVKGKKLDEALQDAGLSIQRTCAGRGVCNACAVIIVDGSVKIGDVVFSKNDTVKSCMSIIESDEITVNLLKKNKIDKIENTFYICRDFDISNSSSGDYAVAIDIGTTTVATILFNLKTGKIIADKTSLNPQTKFGDDVISRIDFASNSQNLLKLHNLIKDLTQNHISILMNDNNIDALGYVVVTGNTAMLHLFFNEDPSGMGKSPWTPSFLDSKVYENSSFLGGLKIDKLISLPSISSFIGGDLSSACVVTDLFNRKDNILLVDIGTNAEILLKYNGKLYSTSAAAGPTLEGYLLSCAVKAVDGAISSFYIDIDDNIKFKTIGNIDAIGICGSGYIDLISVLKDADIINNFGRLDVDNENVTIFNDKNVYKITENIYISEEDISNILKAKAAIYSAIITVFDKLEVDINQIDKCYISGGFGKNINIESAINIGLMPSFDLEKFEYLGNSSLAGAYICALNSEALDSLEDVSKMFENIELNLEPDFEDNYIDALMLDS